MSADACKFCKGSGWYEPKNMGGMMVEPCSRCDAHKKIQAAQKASADVLAPKWTDRRAFQLTERLAGLLRDCNDLDTSSGVMGRLRRIMANAQELTTAFPNYDEPSFLEFLNQLCREDRRNQQEK